MPFVDKIYKTTLKQLVISLAYTINTRIKL
jgi:hypothetical protein